MDNENDFLNRIRQIVENYPKSYTKMLRSCGFMNRYENRSELWQYILDNTKALDDTGFRYSDKTRIFWTINEIKDWDNPLVKCAVCGNPIKNWNVVKISVGYKPTCCRECERKRAAESNVKTCLERYGVTNVFAAESVKSNIAAQIDSIQESRELTKETHYGNRFYNNSVSAVKTKMDKYGSVWNLKKISETKTLKYGNPNWNNPEKNSATKRLNHTFKMSKLELLVEKIFKSRFKDVKTQYTSDKYPFNCDFYIRDIDTYVEYNGLWTHGGHPFDPNSADDTAKLNDWKSRNTKFYDNAIDTWTRRDVNKRETASRNGIKFVELWDMPDVARFLGIDDIAFSAMLADMENKIVINDRKEKAAGFYLTYGEIAFKAFSGYDFPYCDLTDSSAKYELKRLSSVQTKDQTPSRIIRSVHRSMFECRRGKMLSPVEFWNKLKDRSSFDNGEWRKFFENRYVYAESKDADAFRTTGVMPPKMILDGFTITHSADCVSYLKPMLAKRVINEYLGDYSQVFCPFNGFSGIMLGATIGCGKKFVGRDLNARQIDESKTIIDIVRKHGYDIDADLAVADVFNSFGEYESLFCCPPYEDKELWNFDKTGLSIDRNLTCEEWIDVCVSKFKCKKYVFIVDDASVGKYRENIVETLNNESHFGRNSEYIVVLNC